LGIYKYVIAIAIFAGGHIVTIGVALGADDLIAGKPL
jgi:hypothetical protein